MRTEHDWRPYYAAPHPLDAPGFRLPQNPDLMICECGATRPFGAESGQGHGDSPQGYQCDRCADAAERGY